MTDLNTQSASLLGTLLEVTLQATLCLAVILVARVALKKYLRPDWRYALWGVLILRMLLPFSYDAPLMSYALFPSPRVQTDSEMTTPSTPVSSSSSSSLSSSSSNPGADNPPSPQFADDQPDSAPRTIVPSHEAPIAFNTPSSGDLAAPLAPLSDAKRDIPWAALAAGLWLTGALLVLGLFIIRHLRAVRALERDAAPAPEPLPQLLRQLRDELGLSMWPPILLSPSIATPTLIGIFRPRILLPQKLAESASAADLRLILMHELMHLRHRDLWLAWLWLVALSAHWFNPLMWWAGARIRRDREQACDHRVLRALPEADRAAYGHTLLNAVSAIASTPSARLAGGAAIVEDQGELELRLALIQTYSTVRPIHRLSGIVAACLLIGVAFTQTWSVAQHTEPSPLKPSQKGQESLAVTNQPGDPKGLIQLTVLKTHNGLLYEGRVMTWDEIENQLSTIANPRDYFLALGETDVDSTFPVGGVRAFSLEARRGASIVTRLGFAYFSYIGKQTQPSIQGEPAGTSSMDIGAPVIEDDYEGAMADEIAQSYAKSSTDVQDFLRLTAKSFGPLSLWLPEVPYDVIRLSPAERADLTACTDRLLAELQSETYGRHLCENLVAASEIRDERLVPMLLRIAAYHRDDQDYDCRPKWMAIAALARQENESAVPTLVRLVDHGNLNTRMWAQAALARITGQSFGADKQTWANWWNGAGKTPAITADDIKPWTPPASTKVAQAQTTTPSPPAENAKPPQIVSTVPKIGDTAVPADTKELRVTFDQDMAAGFSWTGGGPAFPESAGKAQWLDKRTCVFPVKLQPGKYYRLGINAPSFKNFQSTSGLPAPVTSFWFVTAGADGKPVDGLQAPKIVELSPANGAKDVASTTTELVARFDRPMSEGASWTNPEDKIPEITGKPTWRDNKTCALSVKLEPGKEYVFSLNDAWFINFQSAEGVPLVPVRYTFSTSAETSQSTAAGQAQVSTTKGVPAHAEMRNDSEIRFASSKELVIEIPADNSYVVFGKTLTVSELKELLRTCVASFPSVDVRAHPSASVSAVRSAVAYAKAAGFHEITMFGPLVDVAVREPIRNSREPATPRPQLIASAPAIGDTSVPTGTKELRLTFDQDMLADEHLSCGFVGFTDLEMKLSWPDPRTAVITVAPQPGVVSTIVFNNEQAAEKGWPVFRNKAGVPALPFTIWFINRNADGTPARDKVPPAVIELSPANGDTAVSPNTTELLVHFDRKMRPTTAWGNVDGRFPELTGKPYWREDSMTCVLPVKLTPGKDYVLSLNDARFVDFQSAEGVPLLPVRYTFSTKGN